MTTLLPADFADLEPYADWALPTEGARYAKRLDSSMDEHLFRKQDDSVRFRSGAPKACPRRLAVKISDFQPEDVGFNSHRGYGL